MKFVASKITYAQNSDGDLEVRITLPKGFYHNQQKAKQSVENLRNVDMLSVDIDKHKKSRSYEQNAMLWELIGQIAEAETGYKKEVDTWRIYGELLKQANIKYEIIRAHEQARSILEQSFRAVVEVPQSSKLDAKGNVSKLFWVFYGSSRFTTQEMSLLLEHTMNRCAELGIELERESI